MIRKIATLTLLATFVIVPAAAAQGGGMHHQRSDTMPGMMGSGAMGGGVMGMGSSMAMGGRGMGDATGPSAAAILRMREVLELNDSQAQRLRELQSELAESRRRHMTGVRTARRQAQRILRHESPDFDSYEEAMQEAARHMVRAHVDAARSAVQARDVLTAEQRSELEDAMRMMRNMMNLENPDAGMRDRPRPRR